MMHKILIAVEEPVSARAIIDFIVECPWAKAAEIRVLHAIEPRQAIEKWPSEQYRKEADELVKETVAALRDKLPDAQVDNLVVEEFAKDAILDSAEIWGADTIVIGSHGRRGLTRFLMGSVSSAVANYAPCSVVVVRTQRHEQAQVTGKGNSQVKELTKKA